MVLLGEMRHWVRTLLTFTRPYFGTASIMSKTLAVSTQSGGSLRICVIDTRAPLRSRLSWARRERIWLARCSASIRWCSERSGVAVCFGVVVWDGGDIGGRVYSRSGAVQALFAQFGSTST